MKNHSLVGLMILIGTLLTVAGCSSLPPGGSETSSIGVSVGGIGQLEVKNSRTGGVVQKPTTVTVSVPPSMKGKRARVILLSSYGPPILGPSVNLVPGVNALAIPEGDGVLLIEFLPEEPILITPDEFPVVGRSRGESRIYGYLKPEHFPWQETGNSVLAVWITAGSPTEAISHLGEFLEDTELLTSGVDPGQLPEFVDRAQLVTWGTNGATGDLSARFLKPGTRVDGFSLEVNGITEYATLGAGAASASLGDWQVVTASIAASDLELPEVGAGPARNTWKVEMDTDVGDLIQPFTTEYEIEWSE